MTELKEDGRRFEGAVRARAKLFTHGGSQAVRLPKAFRFEGEEVLIRREGSSVVLEPLRPEISELWARLDAIGGRESFPDRPSQAAPPEPLSFGEE